MPEFFKPEPGLMIWTLISFLMFLFLMSRFAVGPILDMLEKRRKNIEENLAKAEETRQEAERLFAEYQAQLEKAKLEAKSIIEEGRKIGEKIKAEAIEEARKETEQLKKKTLHAIELERDRTLAEIREKTADISVNLASRILKRTITTKDHEDLIREVLSEENRPSEN